MEQDPFEQMPIVDAEKSEAGGVQKRLHSDPSLIFCKRAIKLLRLIFRVLEKVRHPELHGTWKTTPLF